jgi:predicted ATPase/class 3 adenylate cyclase
MEARRERKVVTVLFADLVGFTARAEQLDPEDVEAILRPYHERLRAELERRGGTVEKFIGDAVMAVFGAPVAHEDDPERAVRAALAIRDAIAEDGQLQVRVAVTTGEALVTLDARVTDGEGMVAGDVVNTAARLQSAAPVNGVLVDRSTFRSTRRLIDYAAAEPVHAKGKAEPVSVWAAREARARYGVDVEHEGGAELVGRDRELDLLAASLARARAERTPQLVTLVGVPGIGKTRLVYELSHLVDEDPELIYWRQGRSLPYGEGLAYWALAEMVKAQAGILETDPPAEADAKLVEAAAGIDAEEAERILASLRPLVGLGGGEQANERSERFGAWRQFFEALAEERPTVLVFEDLHWADDDLLDFVDHLVDWGSGVPLLVVCTARPELLERRPGWGGGKPNATTLSISPLSDDDTARLLAALLERSVLPAGVQASLLARAGGNPLYAEQFARLLAERGHDEDLPLPENVQGIIAARLDGLPQAEKQLLQDAAVLGKVFWLGAVNAVGAAADGTAEERLHALERKEFVRRERRSTVGGEREYVFRHVLVRDVAYGQIPRGERASRHERAVAWIERLGRPEDHAEMLAHHYLEALRLRRAANQDQPPEVVARTRQAARDAGDRAFVLGALPTAARFYEAALELTPAGDDDRPELLLAYARTRVDDTELDGVLDEAREGLLGSGKVEAAAEAESLLGNVWLNRGERDTALEHMERARRIVEDREPSREKTFVLQELASASMMGRDIERSIELATQALRLAEELGLEGSRARNLNTLGVSRIAAGDRAGLADLEQAVAIAAAANSHEEVRASGNLTWMTVLLGDLRSAHELHERTLSVASRYGIATLRRWHEAEHVFHCHWEGRWDEAIASADEFIAGVQATSAHYMEASCHAVRGAIALARGADNSALADGERAIELARAIKDPQALNPALAFGGRTRLATGDRTGASALADELLASWKGRPLWEPHETSQGAWLFRDLDRGGQIEQALGGVEGQTPWQDAARRIVTADALGAADLYREIGSVPDEAYSRLRAAHELVRAGNRAEADRQLALARPVVAQLRATAWAAEADALLAASA